MKSHQLFIILILFNIGLTLTGCGNKSSAPGTVLDEAMTVGRTADTFPAADEDYFRDMDGSVPLSVNEVKGRNTWIVWTGGKDRGWDYNPRDNVGSLSFLKTPSPHPHSHTLTPPQHRH